MLNFEQTFYRQVQLAELNIKYLNNMLQTLKSTLKIHREFLCQMEKKCVVQPVKKPVCIDQNAESKYVQCKDVRQLSSLCISIYIS